MFNVLIEVFLDFIAWIASIMTSIFYTPVYLLVQGAMDVDLSVYEGIFTSFLNTYVLPGLAFAKEVFLNFTGLPFRLLSIFSCFIFVTSCFSYYFASS